MCNMTFDNTTGLVSKESRDCMLLHQLSLLGKCYKTYLPQDKKLCIALNGTNYEGYFDCLNSVYKDHPDTADGCYIQ